MGTKFVKIKKKNNIEFSNNNIGGRRLENHVVTDYGIVMEDVVRMVGLGMLEVTVVNLQLHAVLLKVLILLQVQLDVIIGLAVGFSME